MWQKSANGSRPTMHALRRRLARLESFSTLLRKIAALLLKNHNLGLTPSPLSTTIAASISPTGFHKLWSCETLSGFVRLEMTRDPECAARPRAMLLSSFAVGSVLTTFAGGRFLSSSEDHFFQILANRSSGMMASSSKDSIASVHCCGDDSVST